MVAGLIRLGAYGREDMYLTYKPEVTFFKIVFRRTAFFNRDTIPQQFNIRMGFDLKTSCLVFPFGDMVTDMMLRITLPSVVPSDSRCLVRWADNIGITMIRSVELEISGKVIDRLDKDWLQIWQRTTASRRRPNVDGNVSTGYAKMVAGKKLTTFAKVLAGESVYVPLPFWFCKEPGQAFPIRALNHGGMKVNLQLEKASKCIVWGPRHKIQVVENVCYFTPYETIYQAGIPATFIRFDASTRTLYYNNNTASPFVSNPRTAPGVSIVNLTSSLLIINSSNFFVNPSTAESSSGESFNPSSVGAITEGALYVDYVYLDRPEREYMMSTARDQVIERVQIYKNLNPTRIERIFLAFQNPVAELFWVVESIINLNKNAYYSYNRDSMGRPIIKNVTFNLNGLPVSSGSTFFNVIQLFKKHPRATPADGIQLYSFSNEPEQSQPSGSCNLSRINQTELAFVLSVNDPAVIKVYARSYSLMRIHAGVGFILDDQT